MFLGDKYERIRPAGIPELSNEYDDKRRADNAGNYHGRLNDYRCVKPVSVPSFWDVKRCEYRNRQSIYREWSVAKG